MKRSAVVSLNFFKGFDFFSNNKVYFIIDILFFIGVLFGSLCIRFNSNLFSKVKYIFEIFLQNKQSFDFLKQFLTSSSIFLFVLLIFFVFAVSLCGSIFLPVFYFSIASFYGMFSSYICTVYSLRGVAFNLIVFIPSALLFSTILGFAVKNSINFSTQISRLTLYKDYSSCLFLPFKKLTVEYAVYSLLCILAALVDAVFSFFFLDYFIFN